MPDGIIGIVKGFMGRPVSPSYKNTDWHPGQEEVYNEFGAQFNLVIPRSARTELEMQIKQLPGFSTQELLLGSETATYLQADFAVRDVLDTLIIYSRSKYAQLRLHGLLPEAAFKFNG